MTSGRNTVTRTKKGTFCHFRTSFQLWRVRKGCSRYSFTNILCSNDRARSALSGSVFISKKNNLKKKVIRPALKMPMPKNSRFPVKSPTQKHMPRGWPGCCDCLPDTSRPYCYAQSTARDLLFQDMLSDNKKHYFNLSFFSIKVKYLGLTENDQNTLIFRSKSLGTHWPYLGPFRVQLALFLFTVLEIRLEVSITISKIYIFKNLSVLDTILVHFRPIFNRHIQNFLPTFETVPVTSESNRPAQTTSFELT